MTKLGDDLKASLKEALAHARGEYVPALRVFKSVEGKMIEVDPRTEEPARKSSATNLHPRDRILSPIEIPRQRADQMVEDAGWHLRCLRAPALVDAVDP